MKRRKGTALVHNEERILRRVHELALQGKETVHGYGLSRDFTEVEPPGKPMAVSTLYRCLSRLEERGLVKGQLETGPSSHQGPARRVFQLTEQGKTFAADLPDLDS